MAKLRASGPEILDRRWSRVVKSRALNAPIDEVWDIIRDPANRSLWYPASDEFDALTTQTTGVGATFAEREWAWKATSEIVRWDDGRCLGFATRSLNFPGLLRKLYTEFSLEPVDGARTKVTIAGGFSFGLLGWLLVPYTYPQMIGSMWFDYRSSLKALRNLTTS